MPLYKHPIQVLLARLTHWLLDWPKLTGSFVCPHMLVDGHYSVLNGKWPMADCYNPPWTVKLFSNTLLYAGGCSVTGSRLHHLWIRSQCSYATWFIKQLCFPSSCLPSRLLGTQNNQWAIDKLTCTAVPYPILCNKSKIKCTRRRYYWVEKNRKKNER